MAALPAFPRLPCWPEQLAAYIDGRRDQPFAWGTHDCATFAAGAVVAMTGCALADLLPGNWTSARGAARALNAAGGLRAACSAVLGEPVTGPRAALLPRGSVVCVDAGNGPTLGLLAGNGHWCAPGESGLVWRRAAEVAVAWEV